MFYWAVDIKKLLLLSLISGFKWTNVEVFLRDIASPLRRWRLLSLADIREVEKQDLKGVQP